MSPEQARDLAAELAAISDQARGLTRGMDAPALMKPAGGGWSVADNLQHLILTADAMLPLTERAISELESRGANASAPSRLGFMGWLLVKSIEPPARIKTKTTKPFEPLDIDEPLALLDRFLESNVRLDSLIKRANGLATARAQIASPFNARVKYNLYAAFRIMLAHSRRHLWQAAQTKSA